MNAKDAVKIEKYLLDREKPKIKLSEKIMDAVYKQIPKKLVFIGNEKCCPVCKDAICNIGDDGCYGYYCPGCGQAIDWSDSE